MRILFCNIAWMEYYKGIIPGEVIPNSGGSFVKKNQDAHEKYNFEPVYIKPKDHDLNEGEYCLGFVETKSTSGSKANQLHIEKVAGCKAAKDAAYINDVLVIYIQSYNAIAKAENCTLLPLSARSKVTLWKVPRPSQGAS